MSVAYVRDRIDRYGGDYRGTLLELVVTYLLLPGARKIGSDVISQYPTGAEDDVLNFHSLVASGTVS